MAKHKLALEICGYKCKDKGEHCHLNCKTYYCLVKMKQWKNEQIAEEKQQLIDKCKEFCDRQTTGEYYNRRGVFQIDKYIDDMLNFIKGE